MKVHRILRFYKKGKRSISMSDLSQYASKSILCFVKINSEILKEPHVIVRVVPGGSPFSTYFVLQFKGFLLSC